MNTVRPRCFGRSQFERAKQSPQSAHHAPVVQIFEPFENPFVTVAHGGGLRAGDIGPTRRFGQELHPDLLPAKNGRVVENHGGARLQCRYRETKRVFVWPDLLVKCVLVGRGQPLAAVLLRESDPCEAGVEQPTL
jgi:hypothetical protein